MTQSDSVSSDADVQAAPIDAEVPITGYAVRYSPATIDPKKEITNTFVFIYDARGDQYVSELQILNDTAFPDLLEAVQLPNGQIRFFAHESQLPAILAILGGNVPLWLKTRSGRVHIIAGRAKVPGG